MTENPKQPRDSNQLTKLIVDLSIGESNVGKPKDDGKDPAAVALGRKGGIKGGKARAEKLSSERRTEIAKKAAKARWNRANSQHRSNQILEAPKRGVIKIPDVE